jgi:S-adenosyl-L-methionine hydrolase (adenosine-forming)
MKRIAPDADVIDITHGIGPRNVLQGALVLADTLPYMPEGVHVAVVDPGVGSARRAVALAGADGRMYVGPDNGLLLVAAERLGGAERAVSLENDAFFVTPVSRTFHGRDVFAPVAAHLASGTELEQLGPSVPVADLRRLDVAEVSAGPSGVRANVLAIDRFGNVQLNARHAGLGTAVDVNGRRVTVGATFSDVPPGELVLYEDAYGRLALAVNSGDAAAALALRPDDAVLITPA